MASEVYTSKRPHGSATVAAVLEWVWSPDDAPPSAPFVLYLGGGVRQSGELLSALNAVSDAMLDCVVVDVCRGWRLR